jgi:hypothetical protein
MVTQLLILPMRIPLRGNREDGYTVTISALRIKLQMTEVTLSNGRSLSQFTRVEWALVPSGQSSSTQLGDAVSKHGRD